MARLPMPQAPKTRVTPWPFRIPRRLKARATRTKAKHCGTFREGTSLLGKTVPSDCLANINNAMAFCLDYSDLIGAESCP